jgi:hypothetical protein
VVRKGQVLPKRLIKIFNSDSRPKTSDNRLKAEMSRDDTVGRVEYYIRFTKELKYLDTKTYEELWKKAQEGLKTLQGLISYTEKSGV